MLFPKARNRMNGKRRGERKIKEQKREGSGKIKGKKREK